jgi:hypothetical protein
VATRSRLIVTYVRLNILICRAPRVHAARRPLPVVVRLFGLPAVV